ncbi:UDP-glucuronosyltransferase 2C1-like [Alosa sapidissima]|uniref:UDP-glucuronosyltransferase 2C1-like n=1 Tax=Alosa sapidissima TaxID=34773 RepID=UPI001C099D69|nr:UDP-glucuronosyltransferase 2C1-like [Alosa sapidissima]
MLSPVLLALSVLSVCLSGARGGKVLVFPVDGSHWVNMRVIIEELHSRGHSITVVRDSNSWFIKEESPHYKTITIPSNDSVEEFINSLVKTLLNIRIEGKTTRNIELTIELMKLFSDIHRDMCAMLSAMFTDEALMQSLQEAKYDLVLSDPVIAGGVFLAYRLQLPLVFNVRGTLYGDLHTLIGPAPPSYVPVSGTGLTDRMSFSQRILNWSMFMVNKLLLEQMVAHYTDFCNRFFGPDVDFVSLLRNADLWLVRYDFTFEFPHPIMPNVVHMGGFHCKPARPLPVDLEEFVQSSGEHGVIIMSLGTLVAELPSDITDEIAAAFAQLPQKVIWRYTGAKPSTLGNNTLLVGWMPQNDLLGHQKTKVFVAHGGINGVQEAIYHGVPILGLPLMFDQPDNLSRMEAKGTAKVVDIATLDRAVLMEALKEVLYEPSYRENMQRLSRIHHDQPMKPLDRAIFWIEFVMRNGGAPHLRTQSFRMSWIAYHSIDVILTLLMALLVLLLIMFLAIKKCCALLFRKKVKSE